MIGIIVSGRAVPTAASTDPTAPSASSSLRPNHSMPLVNSSAPSRMMTNARTRIEDVHGSDRSSDGAIADADGDDGEDRRARSTTIDPCPGRGRRRRAATMTRTIGVAMTASSPSHRKPVGLEREQVGRRARPRSKAAHRSSGEMPVGDHQDDADDEQADRDVGHRRSAAGRSAARRRTARHAVVGASSDARSSIWTAV